MPTKQMKPKAAKKPTRKRRTPPKPIPDYAAGHSGWWHEPDGATTLHSRVFGRLATLETDESDRTGMLRSWHALYTDRKNTALAAQGLERPFRARFNAIRNGIDALHARIGKNRPTPWVVTIGGNFRLQRRAKRLTRYLDGEFARLKAHEVGSRVLLDALVFGTGALKVYADDGRPAIERVWIGELVVDVAEEANGSIRTLYRRKAMDREVLQWMYPKAKADLAHAKGPEADEAPTAGTEASNLVAVVEAWHLPSGKDKDGDWYGGRHVICADNVTLLDEPYERDDFPFVFLRASLDPAGFWGIGYAERMAGIQSELNSLSSMIADSFRRSAPSIWVEKGAAVDVHKIDNEPMRIYTYAGTPPVFNTPQAVSDQHLRYQESLLQRSYELEGISQLSAQSQKPAGLNSGKALLVFQDVESERFTPLGRAYEQFFVDLADLLVFTTNEIVEGDGDDDTEAPEVTVEDKGVLEVIRYDEVNMGDDEPYRIRIFPASALSQSPAGRLQEVEHLIDLGVLTDPNDIRELINFPDLEAHNSLESAGRNLADKQIEQALEGKRVVANPYLPLPYTHRKAVLSLSLAEIDGAPSSSLDRLRDYIGHVESLMAAAKAEAAAQLPQAPPGPPQATPAAPPALPPAGP